MAMAKWYTQTGISMKASGIPIKDMAGELSEWGVAVYTKATGGTIKNMARTPTPISGTERSSCRW